VHEGYGKGIMTSGVLTGRWLQTLEGLELHILKDVDAIYNASMRCGGGQLTVVIPMSQVSIDLTTIGDAHKHNRDQTTQGQRRHHRAM
jgi:hypothetical protein